MSRQFKVPDFYRSPIISTVKAARRTMDPRKRDLAPATIDFGPVRFKIARHFGFCYGVEHAIEIAYRALDENPGKRIFLLSEMIHNPFVNQDLKARGIRFLRTTKGEQIVPFESLTSEDVVLIPAFGTTLEIEEMLKERGINTKTYNTTCPFVKKVWKKSAQIGKKNYTVVVHGKRYHEETRATISYANRGAPVVVVRDMPEAEDLAAVVRGDRDIDFFYERFPDRYSDDFDPETDLHRIGVVNQTTMLATETQAIAALLRDAMVIRYGEENISDHFADTSDTLCYATNENQNATYALIESGGDVAVVVGGYNSSNTSHLVELCSEHMPSYFIAGPDEMVAPDRIWHFDLHTHSIRETHNWMPEARPLDIVLTAGASCPDALLDRVMRKIIRWFGDTRSVEEALEPFAEAAAQEPVEPEPEVTKAALKRISKQSEHSAVDSAPRPAAPGGGPRPKRPAAPGGSPRPKRPAAPGDGAPRPKRPSLPPGSAPPKHPSAPVAGGPPRPKKPLLPPGAGPPKPKRPSLPTADGSAKPKRPSLPTAGGPGKPKRPSLPPGMPSSKRPAAPAGDGASKPKHPPTVAGSAPKPKRPPSLAVSGLPKPKRPTAPGVPAKLP
ncbi:MAG: 4-hydroxy-3-methylbut-2-enyl diphosphate reductase [Bacteroidota bacterium]